jgi:hypothetical protein
MADEQITAQAPRETALLSPAAHAVLDYAVAGAYLLVGAALFTRHRRAGTLALLNGAIIVGASVCTDYPGGIWPRFSFKTHRTLDVAQASFAGLGPYLMGFGSDPEASYFYDQAATEMGVIAATDWDATSRPADVRSPRAVPGA